MAELNTSKGLMIRLLRKLDLSDRINPDWIVKQLPFAALLVGLGVLHIVNTHMAEEKVRHINRLEKELKELRWENMSVQSELMYRTRQSEMAKQLNEKGLKELSEPPFKIEVKEGEYK